MIHPESDVDIAVYLKTLSIPQYIKEENEITSKLITELHTDKVDIRILNVLPFVMK